MRQISVKIYRYNELSQQAKDKVAATFAAERGYPYEDEALASLRKLAEFFGGKLADYEVDFFAASYSQAKFEMPELTPEEIKEKLDLLGSYDADTLNGNGDCKLTGYCADEDAIDGFRRAWFKGERNLEELMEAAFDSWLTACQEDCNEMYTDPEFAEFCEANCYEFFENGEIY